MKSLNKNSKMSASKQPTHCPECHQPLDNPADVAFGVCSNPMCRGPFLRRRNLESDAKRRKWRETFAKDTLENWPSLTEKTTHVAFFPTATTEVVVIVVPSLVRDINPLPDDRKAMFIEHLDVVLEDATKMIAAGREAEKLRTEFAHRRGAKPAPSPSIVINGCTTCRGYCCQHGGTTAFLTAGFLAWQILVDEQVTEESLREQYIKCLPIETVENSCVYHAVRGCSLPRELRNEICNNFHCEGLMDAFDSFDQEASIYSIAIATDGTRPHRIGVMELGGLHREIELQTN